MALTKVDLANTVEGVLPVANGGTGATTQAAAAANVLPTQSGNNGKYLTTDGTNTSWGTVTSNPGTVTSVATGTGLTGGPITSSGTVAIANTTVTAGSYTNASLTVNAQGQLTAASSGTAPVTSVSAGTGISSSGGTTPTITNAGVTSVTAGTGISVSASTGGVTITNTAVSGGTVTSVATGNGLQGGTITTSGTLSLACPAANTVGSYVFAQFTNGTSPNFPSYGSNWGAGTIKAGAYSNYTNGWYSQDVLSGTWKWMGSNTDPGGGWTYGYEVYGLACRVS